MKLIGPLAAFVVCAALILPRLVVAQTTPSIPPSIATPDKVDILDGKREATGRKFDPPDGISPLPVLLWRHL